MAPSIPDLNLLLIFYECNFGLLLPCTHIKYVITEVSYVLPSKVLQTYVNAFIWKKFI